MGGDDGGSDENDHRKGKTMAKRTGPAKKPQAPAPAQPQVDQRNREMEAAFKEVAQRYDIRYLVILAGDRHALHSITAACEGWIAQMLDRAVRQAVGSAGVSLQGGVETVLRTMRGAMARDQVKAERVGRSTD